MEELLADLSTLRADMARREGEDVSRIAENIEKLEHKMGELDATQDSVSVAHACLLSEFEAQKRHATQYVEDARQHCDHIAYMHEDVQPPAWRRESFFKQLLWQIITTFIMCTLLISPERD